MCSRGRLRPFSCPLFAWHLAAAPLYGHLLSEMRVTGKCSVLARSTTGGKAGDAGALESGVCEAGREARVGPVGPSGRSGVGVRGDYGCSQCRSVLMAGKELRLKS